MSFNNLLLALALTVLWPLVLMGVLAAAEWLERRTLTGREVAPRGLRPALSAPPEAAQAGMAGAAEANAGLPAAWAVASRAAPGGPRDEAPGPEPFDGSADAAEREGERAVARRTVGGGRHVRRAGGGRHERRG
jgi:hypothetical protein